MVRIKPTLKIQGSFTFRRKSVFKYKLTGTVEMTLNHYTILSTLKYPSRNWFHLSIMKKQTCINSKLLCGKTLSKRWYSR